MNPMLSNTAITAILSPELTDADIRWMLVNIINMYDDKEIDLPPPNSLLAVIWRMIEAEQSLMITKAKESHNRRSLAGKQSHKNQQNVFKSVNENTAMISIDNIREDKRRLDNISKDNIKSTSIDIDYRQKPRLDFSNEDIFLTDDPVGYALWLTHSNKELDRRTFAKYLKKDSKAFRDAVNELQSELLQGEHKNAKNLPAILTKKLKRIK